jgi:hypothetical protein
MPLPLDPSAHYMYVQGNQCSQFLRYYFSNCFGSLQKTKSQKGQMVSSLRRRTGRPHTKYIHQPSHHNVLSVSIIHIFF